MQPSSNEPEHDDAAQAPRVDQPAEAGQAEPAGTAARGESGFARFLRAALRGAALVVGLFAVGLLVAYLLLYRPAQQQLTQAKTDLAAAQTQNEDLTQQLNTLETQNQDLAGRADSAEAHVLLLQVQADVSEARLALAREDPDAAREALSATPALLDQLAPTLDPVDAGLAATLKSRLDLAVNEMLSDPEIAASDLAIVSDRLTQAETSLFK